MGCMVCMEYMECMECMECMGKQARGEGVVAVLVLVVAWRMVAHGGVCWRFLRLCCVSV